jgi:pimeloyl-ACP methyl ester carboxylesterase
MGGTVSLSVAIQYPERVSKVVVVGSPIAGSSLALPLKWAGYRPIAFMLFNMMGLFRMGVRIASPFICRDPRFPDMMDRDLSRTTVESFLRSIASLRRTDLRPMLDHIKVPVMGMYGDKDNIVHPLQWKPLSAGIENACTERFPKAGHFIMLDEPQPFINKLKTFLDEETPAR